MAVTSTHQLQSIPHLTPPSSSHGGGGMWDLAVPLSEMKQPYGDHIPDDEPPTQQLSSRQPLNSRQNGSHHASPSDTLDPRPFRGEDGTHLQRNHPHETHTKENDFAANGDDFDGVLAPEVGKPRSRNTSQTRQKRDRKRKDPAGGQLDEIEKNNDYWIHRDKLKEIESRELIEAGLRVGRASRSNSRSQSASRAARSRKDSEVTDPMNSGDDQPGHRRMVSPVLAEAEEGIAEDNTHWDLRTPEEIAAEREAIFATRTTHLVRPSTSRIPIAKTSPAPVPTTFVERDAPLPRSRKGSANLTGDAIAANGARVRSGSVSSQVLLDDFKPSRPSEEILRAQQNASTPTSPAPSSPTKAKTPAKPTPVSGARKASAQKSTPQTKQRTTSATSSGKRPGTSGGMPRPTTSHNRPEGEAPWIATMYKPDPMLPPDQQIIPTHAKRMQQEQWETEGKTGTIYDRDFRLLNAQEIKDKRASQIQPLDLKDLKQLQDDQQWPLPSPTKTTAPPAPESIDTNVRSPTNEGGNYKLTPTIPQSPRAPSRAASRTDVRPGTSGMAPKPTDVIRLPEPPTDGEKKKKRCMCIVM
ncbi:uncharacterized protein EI97DRAFT_88106 [Westerdykella ornata]|uniref:Uncharacterized protein n=1 Tax=Westerdykella ornata TaxID=318751 RepID=A0A6A6JHH3_WESOR|nr:uncharacterized protein EI97DRAFT_88106 [Westerdykella ornata]KAF2275096.1 hypothetical protein EI97DRAFT_88106 [Westerdykella ornata]